MLELGGLPSLLLFAVPVYGLAVLVFYWVIRLAVRHGTLDAYRVDRTDQRIALMTADERRRSGP